jgi:hypothetical protein
MEASFIALQAADLHSTFLAIGRGGREINPLLRPLADSPAAMLATKGGMAAFTVYVNERLRRKKPRGALALMVAESTFYAIIAAHNYGLARR